MRQMARQGLRPRYPFTSGMARLKCVAMHLPVPPSLEVARERIGIIDSFVLETKARTKSELLGDEVTSCPGVTAGSRDKKMIEAYRSHKSQIRTVVSAL